jgi:hypothetical protein
LSGLALPLHIVDEMLKNMLLCTYIHISRFILEGVAETFQIFV